MCFHRKLERFCIPSHTDSYDGINLCWLSLLIRLQSHLPRGLTTGGFEFVDPYDRELGVLACPDLDWDIDRFHASVYLEVLLMIRL
jgi:hypothetical protein